jgi:integrase
MRKLYTDLAIKKLKAHAKKRLELADSGAAGLYITVQPASGAKSFALRFRRPDGRNARLVLGGFDPTPREPHPQGALQIGASLTLVEARLLAGRIHHERAGGVDVINKRKSDKLRARLQNASAKDNSFATLTRQYFEHHARHKTRRWIEAARYFGLAYREGQAEPVVLPGGLVDQWADRPVKEICAADIRVVRDDVIRRGTPGLERREDRRPRAEASGRAFHARLSAFFGWCVDEGRLDSNPCSKLKRPPPGKSRDRVLSDDELRKVWIAADGLAPQYRALTRLLILLGQRLREVGGLRWSELSPDLSTWVLPGSRVKNGREHRLMLPEAAREIIRAVPKTSDTYVLSLGADEPLESYSRAKRRLDDLAGVTEWTWHDLRRTCASGLQRLAVPLPVTERILNHASGSISGIASIYHRHTFDAEAREALERWADRVARLVEGKEAAGNVIEMRRA